MEELTDREKKKIDILLNEYQACHRNRNHYDSLVWTVGSIFVAASLALLGLSLSPTDFPQVNAMAGFSFFLIFIWYAHMHHVNPYVLASIKQFHEIERGLRRMGFDIRLHKSIAEREQKWRGIHTFVLIVAVTCGTWIVRLVLLAHPSDMIWVPIYVVIMLFMIVSRFRKQGPSVSEIHKISSDLPNDGNS